jgi:catechol 2,3-dioxygenase-like lactoylglutathione lyase family enzyme
MTAISFSVSGLERSVTFYRTAFGLEVFGSVPPQPSMNAAMARLFDVGDAKYRQATFRIPHTDVILRLMEFRVEHAAQRPGLGDPGQVRPRFLVSDMDVTLAGLKLAGAEIVSASSGGQVSALKPPTHVIARDPDGYVIEIERDESLQSSVATDVSPVVALHVVLTTTDTEKKLAFYKKLLGFDIEPGVWSKTVLDAGDVRRSTGRDLGGATRLLDLEEYHDAGRAKLGQGRVQDLAMGVASFIVRDLDDTLSAVRQAKLHVVTMAEAPVSLAQTRRMVVQDPDGAYVEMSEE